MHKLKETYEYAEQQNFEFILGCLKTQIEEIRLRVTGQELELKSQATSIQR